MADNLTTQTSALATIPTATVIATDDAGAGGHVQLVKLAVSTNGSATALTADNTDGLLVKLTNPGDISGTSVDRVRVQVTPTVSTSLYSTKDNVGALLTFANAAATSGGSGVIEEIQVVDKAQQMKDYDLVLFDRSITTPTDNAIFDPTDTELGYVVGVIAIGGWADFNDNSVFSAPVNTAFVLDGSTSLYGVLVVRSATGPTYVGTSDIVVTLTIARN